MMANMRNPRERLADLRAQIACHRTGAAAGRAGGAVRAGPTAAGHGRAACGQRAADRGGDGRLPDGTYRAADVMEGDGITTGDVPIEVAVRIRGERMTVDFAGTAPQQPGNVNCPIAVTRSAVYYVVRMACDPDIPASGGAYEPVEIAAPDRLPGERPVPGAVVAGNVETSSRIVDVVQAALGLAVPLPAMGQGTMNNVSFGNGGSRTTRRSAAGRARARMRRGRARCTWRCRTR